MSLNPKSAIIITSVFLLFLLMFYLGFLSPLVKVFSFFFHSAQSVAIEQSAQVNSKIKSIGKSKIELNARIQKLEEEINTLNAQLIFLHKTEKENNELRELLEFKKEGSYTLLSTEIINKSNLELDKSLVLSKGTNAGIRNGDAVVIGNGILIGRISDVAPFSSKVQLTIDNNSNILATLDGTEHTITGVLTGVQGTSLILSLIPKDISLVPKQKVITNGFQERIPSHLILGEIISLQESENEIFNIALVEPPYFIEDITVVAVITEQENDSL